MIPSARMREQFKNSYNRTGTPIHVRQTNIHSS